MAEGEILVDSMAVGDDMSIGGMEFNWRILGSFTNLSKYDYFNYTSWVYRINIHI